MPIYGDERDSFRFGRYRDAQVFLHWSWVVFAVFILFWRSFEPLAAVGQLLGMTLLVLVHELGHAILVRAFGERVLAISFFAWGGECRHTAEDLEPHHHAIIAWGGVLAQGVLFVPAWLLARLHPTFGNSLVDAVIWIFVGPNVSMMCLNMLPVRPFDGYHALQLPAHAYRYFRARRLADKALRKARQKRGLPLATKDDAS